MKRNGLRGCQGKTSESQAKVAAPQRIRIFAVAVIFEISRYPKRMKNEKTKKPIDYQWPNFKMISHYRGRYIVSDYNHTAMLAPIEEQHQIAIAFQTKKDGQIYRAAIKMTDNPDMTEIVEAMEKMIMAFTTPNSPQVRVVKGSATLVGAEMITSSLAHRIKVQLAAKK
jgi:hypothetical protein